LNQSVELGYHRVHYGL